MSDSIHDATNGFRPLPGETAPIHSAEFQRGCAPPRISATTSVYERYHSPAACLLRFEDCAARVRVEDETVVVYLRDSSSGEFEIMTSTLRWLADRLDGREVVP